MLPQSSTRANKKARDFLWVDLCSGRIPPGPAADTHALDCRQGESMKALLLLLPITLFAADKGPDYITKEVRHELVSLPYYSLFDNLAYRVDGTKLTLFGQVVRPQLNAEPGS